MYVHAVRDVDHAATGRFTRGPETFVIIKVEDTLKGRTRPTRTDKWNEELPVVDIDKANEIELTVYDKSGAHPTPIGMMWIRISDIAEEMRRKKIESELNNSQWVTADKMENSPNQSRTDSAYSTLNPTQDRNSRASTGRETPSASAAHISSNAAAIDAWFALEPVGSIHLTISFSKSMLTQSKSQGIEPWQRNKAKTEDLSISALIAKAPYVNAKKKSTNYMAINLFFSSSIISCDALCAGTS